jgi:hypothetical protein
MRTLFSITCQNQCKATVDKYVEFDLVLIAMDLLLLKPQVYRHLLFNRLEFNEKGIHVNIFYSYQDRKVS